MGLDQQGIASFFNESTEDASPEVTLLGPEDAAFARSFPTNLKRMKTAKFDRLFKHGYAVADATINAFARDQFPGAEKIA